MFSRTCLAWVVLGGALVTLPSARAEGPFRRCSSCQAGSLCDPFAGAGVLVDPSTFGYFETRWRLWPVILSSMRMDPPGCPTMPPADAPMVLPAPDGTGSRGSPFPARNAGRPTLPPPVAGAPGSPGAANREGSRPAEATRPAPASPESLAGQVLQPMPEGAMETVRPDRGATEPAALPGKAPR